MGQVDKVKPSEKRRCKLYYISPEGEIKSQINKPRLLARLQPMVTTFQTEKRHGYSVQFSPFYPQRLACTTSQHYGIAGNGRVFVFELIPGRGLEPLRVFDYNNGVFDVAWSESNENVLVTAGGDGALQVWDVTQKQGPLKVLKEHTKEIYGVSWSQTRNEHFVLSASWDQSIKLWDIHSDKSLNTFSGHNGLVYSAVWSPHFPGCFSSTSADHTLRVWDIRNPQMATTTIPAHNAEILTCDWAKYNENMLFTGSVDCLIRGWDVRRPDVCLCVLQGHEMAVRRIKTSPHLGNILASASYDFTVRTWDMNAGHPLETIEHHTEFVYGLDFNLHVPGQIADCSWDELVRVYSLSSCLPREAP